MSVSRAMDYLRSRYMNGQDKVNPGVPGGMAGAREMTPEEVQQARAKQQAYGMHRLAGEHSARMHLDGPGVSVTSSGPLRTRRDEGLEALERAVRNRRSLAAHFNIQLQEGEELLLLIRTSPEMASLAGRIARILQG